MLTPEYITNIGPWGLLTYGEQVILWSILFIGVQIVNGVLSSIVALLLQSIVANRGDRDFAWVVAITWGATWLGFTALWVRYVSDITWWREVATIIVTTVWGAPIATVMAILAYRHALGRPQFVSRSVASLIAAISVAFLTHLLIRHQMFSPWLPLLFCQGSVFALMSTMTKPSRIVFPLILYVIVGLSLVLPLPPLGSSGFYTVSLIFPYWGVGMPAYLAVRLLACAEPDQDPKCL